MKYPQQCHKKVKDELCGGDFWEKSVSILSKDETTVGSFQVTVTLIENSWEMHKP